MEPLPLRKTPIGGVDPEKTYVRPPKNVYQQIGVGSPANIAKNYAKIAARQAKADAAAGQFGKPPNVKELSKMVSIAGKRMRKDSRWTMLVDGRLDIEDLTDEELRRGQLRDKNGHFTGSKPTWVPQKFIEAMQRQILVKADKNWNDNLLAAQQALIALGMDQRVEAGVRLRALTYIIERSVGKIPDKVEMTGTIKPWEALLQDAVYERDATVEIIEGEFTEEENKDGAA